MMWNVESIGNRILKSNKLVLLAFVVAVVAAIFLIMIEYLYLPLGVDGGWYSYPALALSRQGDPAENRQNIEELQNIKGVKASFNQDFRRSVRILPMSWWFRIVGTNIWRAKLFGIFEWCMLMGVAYLVLRQVSKDRNITLLCFSIFLMDGVAMLKGSADLRADVMLATLTLLVFLFTRVKGKRYRIFIFLFGILSIHYLALIRITSAVPLAFLISYLMTELSISWKNLSKFRKGFYLSLIMTGILSFIYRYRLWNLYVPTEFPGNFLRTPPDTVKFAGRKLTQGMSSIIEKEVSRWTDYFFISNLGEFLAVVLALLLFVLYLFGLSNKKSTSALISISVGCLFAIGILTFIDPAPWPAHALVVVPFFIVILALELNLPYSPKIIRTSICFLFVFVLLSAGIKVARGLNIMQKSMQNEYSNTAVFNVINDVFKPKDKDYIVIGPTELWPYFNPKSNVVIIEARKRSRSLSDYIETVDFIILNNDYEHYDFENRFRNTYPHVKLKTIAKVGNLKSGWHFVKIIKPSLSLTQNLDR